jgi:hypothetical protein
MMVKIFKDIPEGFKVIANIKRKLITKRKVTRRKATKKRR